MSDTKPSATMPATVSYGSMSWCAWVVNIMDEHHAKITALESSLAEVRAVVMKPEPAKDEGECKRICSHIFNEHRDVNGVLVDRYCKMCGLKDMPTKQDDAGAEVSPFAPGQPRFGEVCQHSKLRRSCDECDMAEEIEKLRAERDSLRSQLKLALVSKHIEVGERYPNLEAALAGCVSGSPSEWPRIKAEILSLTEERDSLREKVASLESELLRVRTTGHGAAHELDNIAVECGLGPSPAPGVVAVHVRGLREKVGRITQAMKEVGL